MLLYDLEFYYKSQKKPSIGVLRKRCFPVNVLYIFRTPFPKNTSGGLFLKSVASKNLNEERILEINYHICFFVFCFLFFFWVSKMFKFSAYLDSIMSLKNALKRSISQYVILQLRSHTLEHAKHSWAKYSKEELI